MAVETNKGDAIISPTQTLTGMAAAGLNGKNRRKRPSSLMSTAGSLPSVESSLDDFISRANQTLTDPDQWNAAEVAAKQQDSDQREQDQQRWRAAEHQLREGEAREQSLRRQLDGLQGRLAEAEARAAVAGSGSQDGVIADLKMRLTRADERIQAAEYHASQADQRANQAESRATQLTSELAAAKTEPRPSGQFFNQGDSDERVRLAEAKATKALAIAKAASAGLTVSQADIAAIESGLVVADMPQAKTTNWLAVGGAFIGGLAIMFGVSKAMQKDQAPVAAAAAPPAETAPAPAPAPAPKPTVTPIEDNTAPVKNAEAAAPAPAPTEQPKADPIPVPAVADEPKPAAKHPQAVAAQPQAKHPQAAAAPSKKQPAAAKSNAGIADPFGDSAPAKTPAKKAPADKKPASGIADPFGN